MPPWRVVLLVLPQAGVAHASRTFHTAAMAAPSATIEATDLGVLVDSMAVIVLGWLTLAANLLVAVVLLRYAAKRDIQAVRRPDRTPAPSASRRPSEAREGVGLHGTAIAGLEACPRVIATTPFDRISPRRAG